MPTNKPIRERMLEALKDSSISDEQRTAIEAALRDNLGRYAQQTGRTYLAFLGFAALYTLVMATDLKSLELAGIALERTNPGVLFLPVLASFSFYHSVCLFIFQDFIGKALSGYYKETMRAFYENDITDLLGYPVFMEIENTFDNILEMPAASFSTLWVGILGLVAFAGPVLWFGVASYWIVILPSGDLWWRIAALALIWMFALRALMLIVQTWKY